MKTDTKEIQEKFLDTSPIQNNIINNIDILMDILTDVEFGIFVVLARNRLPMTTRNIRSNLIIQQMMNSNKKALQTFADEYKAKKLDEIEKHSKTDIMDTPKFIAYAEKMFRKLGEKFPSFEGVDTSLESLRKPGILWRRAVNYRNAKQVWLINPKLLSKWREKRSELLKRRDLKTVDEKVLAFYDID